KSRRRSASRVIASSYKRRSLCDCASEISVLCGMEIGSSYARVLPGTALPRCTMAWLHDGIPQCPHIYTHPAPLVDGQSFVLRHAAARTRLGPLPCHSWPRARNEDLSIARQVRGGTATGTVTF